MNTNIDVEITISFVFKNVIDEDALQDVYSGDLTKCIEDMIKSDGICGIIDSNVKVVNVKKL